jgi:dihydrofolate reductase
VLSTGTVRPRDLNSHQSIDRYHLFTIPILLAAGTPLFPQASPPPRPTTFKLEHTSTFPSGVIESIYTRAE